MGGVEGSLRGGVESERGGGEGWSGREGGEVQWGRVGYRGGGVRGGSRRRGWWGGGGGGRSVGNPATETKKVLIRSTKMSASRYHNQLLYKVLQWERVEGWHRGDRRR